jgi:hypothetical protein
VRLLGVGAETTLPGPLLKKIESIRKSRARAGGTIAEIEITEA